MCWNVIFSVSLIVTPLPQPHLEHEEATEQEAGCEHAVAGEARDAQEEEPAQEAIILNIRSLLF